MNNLKLHLKQQIILFKLLNLVKNYQKQILFKVLSSY